MARIARIKAEGEAFYHVVSRIANKAFLLNNKEKKRVFVNMMHRAADFSGVDLITYVEKVRQFVLGMVKTCATHGQRCPCEVAWRRLSDIRHKGQATFMPRGSTISIYHRVLQNAVVGIAQVIVRKKCKMD